MEKGNPFTTKLGKSYVYTRRLRAQPPFGHDFLKDVVPEMKSMDQRRCLSHVSIGSNGHTTTGFKDETLDSVTFALIYRGGRIVTRKNSIRCY